MRGPAGTEPSRAPTEKGLQKGGRSAALRLLPGARLPYWAGGPARWGTASHSGFFPDQTRTVWVPPSPLSFPCCLSLTFQHWARPHTRRLWEKQEGPLSLWPGTQGIQLGQQSRPHAGAGPPSQHPCFKPTLSHRCGPSEARAPGDLVQPDVGGPSPEAFFCREPVREGAEGLGHTGAAVGGARALSSPPLRILGAHKTFNSTYRTNVFSSKRRFWVPLLRSKASFVPPLIRLLLTTSRNADAKQCL